MARGDDSVHQSHHGLTLGAANVAILPLAKDHSFQRGGKVAKRCGQFLAIPWCCYS